MIHDRLQATVSDRRPEPDASDPRISPQDLATFLASRFNDAGWSRTDHFAWVYGLLLELGITSLDELDGLLTSVDSAAINARMSYRYPAGEVRRLADVLLAVSVVSTPNGASPQPDESCRGHLGCGGSGRAG